MANDAGRVTERWSNIKSIKGVFVSNDDNYLVVTAATDGVARPVIFKTVLAQEIVKETCLRAFYSAFAAEQSNVKVGLFIESTILDGKPDLRFVRSCELKTID
jgi:hypothetical protein